jgi:hypothetical protein
MGFPPYHQTVAAVVDVFELDQENVAEVEDDAQRRICGGTKSNPCF